MALPGFPTRRRKLYYHREGNEVFEQIKRSRDTTCKGEK